MTARSVITRDEKARGLFMKLMKATAFIVYTNQAPGNEHRYPGKAPRNEVITTENALF